LKAWLLEPDTVVIFPLDVQKSLAFGDFQAGLMVSADWRKAASDEESYLSLKMISVSQHSLEGS